MMSGYGIMPRQCSYQSNMDQKTPDQYREADKVAVYQRAAFTRSTFDMLELYDGTLSRTVLRAIYYP